MLKGREEKRRRTVCASSFSDTSFQQRGKRKIQELVGRAISGFLAIKIGIGLHQFLKSFVIIVAAVLPKHIENQLEYLCQLFKVFFRKRRYKLLVSQLSCEKLSELDKALIMLFKELICGYIY